MLSTQQTLDSYEEESSANDIEALAFTENPMAMLILDENATILKANQAFKKLTKYNDIELLGEHISLLESNKNGHSLYDSCYMHYNSCEIYILCKSDVHLCVYKNSKHILNHGKQYCILTLQDITEQKRILEHYQHLSTHDSLTGLANRTLLHDNFKEAQKRAIKNDQKILLLLCDINGLKQLNDSYGHDFGDETLKVVAKILEKLLCANDTVSRYGGDEFVLILEDITRSNQISQIVDKIRSAFPVSIMNGEQACQINMSIGSAFFPNEGSNFDQLIKIADQNMYQEKKHFYNLLQN